MRTSSLLLAGVVLLFASAFPLPAADAPFTARELRQGFRENAVLAKPLATRRTSADADEARDGTRVRHRWERFDGLRLIDVPEGETPDRMIARLRATGRYEFVQRDTLRQATVAPNDPSFNRQWPLRNDGTNNGLVGSDIKATDAWDVRTDASTVIVAVIDTGIRLDHPDLAANLWRNPSLTPGFNDLHGARFTNGNGRMTSGDPSDDQGHGTHVAGIIGAVGNNGTGIAGVAWRVQLMALKFLRAGTGRGSTSDAIGCIDYAIQKGAHIINASYGAASGAVTEFDPAEALAIRRARDAGIIFVAAAGNDSANMDLLAHYPASHRLENVISVAASTARDDAPVFSNFGSGSVELFAPGSEVYSAGYTNAEPYVTRSGTSMAAPHVAGALALLKAQFPADTYRQLINRLLRSVDPVPAFAGRVQTGGRLNLDRALRSTDNRPFNDDFADRARLSGANLVVRSVNTGATTETEPPVAGQTAGATLWWQWTPTFSAGVRVSTTGSSYDTLIGVFVGNSLGTLTAVAANDDAPGRVTSQVDFVAQAGTTYQIVVGGKAGATGLTLLDIGSIPPNDNFAGAQVIAGRSGAVAADNAQATLEPGEPRILTLTGGKSLWYRWTAPASGRYQFSLKSEGFDPILAIYTGSSLGALTLVAANDDADTATGGTTPNKSALVTFAAQAGTTYSIQTDGKAAGGSPPTNAPFTLTYNDSLWQAVTAGSVTSAPVVGPDGALYVGSTDGTFHAFNADGTRRWPALSLNEASQDTSAAVLAPDGTLYLGSGRGAVGSTIVPARLRALNSATGELKWDITVGNGLNANNAIALAADGTLYLHSEEGRLFAYTDRGTSAAQKWSFPVPGTSYASATIAPDGTIYLGSDDQAGGHRFYAINPDGTSKWTFTADNAIYTAAAIDGAGNVYFGTLTSGRLYSLTPTGAQRWIYTGARLGTSSSPALSPDGGTVYFAGYDGVLHAVDTATGTARWRFPLGKEVRASSPAVDRNGVVYVGSYDHLLYAVNSDGTLQRTWASGNIIRSSPAIAGTTLYVGSNDRTVYAFDIGAGTAGPWPQFRHNARRTGRAAVEPLAVLASPESRTALLGQPLTLRVIATGEAPLVYQWSKDGVPLAGATGPTFSLPAVTDAAAGSYVVTIRGPQGSVSSTPALIRVEPVTVGRLTNLSVRTRAGTGGEVFTVGFTVGPGEPKPILLRAIGPTLTGFGVGSVLADPRLAVFSGSSVVASNDNWAASADGGAALSAAFALAGAFPLPVASTDAALVQALPPGSYTAQITGPGAETGVALAEVYDTAPAGGARLVNLSARAQVGTGADLLIAGFTISGNVPKQVLVRGIGPALVQFGVTGALNDPVLTIYREAEKVAENDNWDGSTALTDAFRAVGAFPLSIGNSRDAALLVTLAPGSYTAQVSGMNGSTGIALVEVYEAP